MSPAPPPVRVLMVVQRLLPYLAGAEVQALTLASALDALGVPVHVVGTRYVPGLAARETVRGVDVRRLPVIRGRPLLRPTQLLSTAAWVTIHARDYDVIHAHCLSPASLGAAIAARVSGVPVIVKPSLGGADGEMARLRRSAAASPLLSVLRRVDRFAVLSDDIEAELVHAGVARERLVRVHNGIDLETFRPPRPGERERLRRQLGFPGGRVVLFAGQLVARKGIVETLQAWGAVVPAFDNALLVVVGDGPERPAVIEAANDPAARVRYLGVVGNLSEVMRASDLFVLASRNESFGNVIIEAMASGLPVIVGATGVAAQLRIDPDAGRVLQHIDPTAIARGLRDILAGDNCSAALGARARALVQQFEYRMIARRYVATYRSMVDGRLK
jgi:teichuronic acid biosynthesis glycosyltransferase TuaC